MGITKVSLLENPLSTFSPWVIFHVPHNSTVIPQEVRSQFSLSDQALSDELIKMTDHHTFDLFAKEMPSNQVIRSLVSRLVMDVERFEDDVQELMSQKGMGAIYMSTHAGLPLRHPLTQAEREILLSNWYRPHHLALTDAVNQMIAQYGQALVIDAHSFPAVALPYELDQNPDRPEICIGTDDFHTPSALVNAMTEAFSNAGFDVRLNSPFAGALVPMNHYGKDPRVSAVMIEVRRDLYIDETTGLPLANFDQMAQKIQGCIAKSLNG